MSVNKIGPINKFHPIRSAQQTDSAPPADGSIFGYNKASTTTQATASTVDLSEFFDADAIKNRCWNETNRLRKPSNLSTSYVQKYCGGNFEHFSVTAENITTTCYENGIITYETGTEKFITRNGNVLAVETQAEDGKTIAEYTLEGIKDIDKNLYNVLAALNLPVDTLFALEVSDNILIISQRSHNEPEQETQVYSYTVTKNGNEYSYEAYIIDATNADGDDTAIEDKGDTTKADGDDKVIIGDNSNAKPNVPFFGYSNEDVIKNTWGELNESEGGSSDLSTSYVQKYCGGTFKDFSVSAENITTTCYENGIITYETGTEKFITRNGNVLAVETQAEDGKTIAEYTLEGIEEIDTVLYNELVKLNLSTTTLFTITKTLDGDLYITWRNYNAGNTEDEDSANQTTGRILINENYEPEILEDENGLSPKGLSNPNNEALKSWQFLLSDQYSFNTEKTRFKFSQDGKECIITQGDYKYQIVENDDGTYSGPILLEDQGGLTFKGLDSSSQNTIKNILANNDNLPFKIDDNTRYTVNEDGTITIKNGEKSTKIQLIDTNSEDSEVKYSEIKIIYDENNWQKFSIGNDSKLTQLEDQDGLTVDGLNIINPDYAKYIKLSEEQITGFVNNESTRYTVNEDGTITINYGENDSIKIQLIDTNSEDSEVKYSEIKIIYDENNWQKFSIGDDSKLTQLEDNNGLTIAGLAQTLTDATDIAKYINSDDDVRFKTGDNKIILANGSITINGKTYKAEEGKEIAIDYKQGSNNTTISIIQGKTTITYKYDKEGKIISTCTEENGVKDIEYYQYEEANEYIRRLENSRSKVNNGFFEGWLSEEDEDILYALFYDKDIPWEIAVEIATTYCDEATLKNFITTKLNKTTGSTSPAEQLANQNYSWMEAQTLEGKLAFYEFYFTYNENKHYKKFITNSISNPLLEELANCDADTKKRFNNIVPYSTLLAVPTKCETTIELLTTNSSFVYDSSYTPNCNGSPKSSSSQDKLKFILDNESISTKDAYYMLINYFGSNGTINSETLAFALNEINSEEYAEKLAEILMYPYSDS